VLHGNQDEAVPVDMSRAYVAAAEAVGDPVTYRELDGVDHMSLIDPRSPAWALVVDEIQRLR
jgi:acetyl esterase/lipase